MTLKSKSTILNETISTLEFYENILKDLKPNITDNFTEEYKKILSSTLHMKKVCKSDSGYRYLTKDTIERKLTSLHCDFIYFLSLLRATIDIDGNKNKRKYFVVKILESKYKPNMVHFKAKSINELRKQILSIYKPTDISVIYINTVRLSCKQKFKDNYFNDVESFFIKNFSELNLDLSADDNLQVIYDFINKQKTQQLKFLIKEKKLRDTALSKFKDKRDKLKSKGVLNSKALDKDYYNLYNTYWSKRGLSDKLGSLIDTNSYGELEDYMELQSLKQLEQIKKHIINEAGKVKEIYNVCVSAKGDLNFNADCENGKVQVKTISAGGHNIQIFHYRTVTHLLKY